MDELYTGVIYGLHNGDGRIRYIGYTTQKPQVRLGQHKSDSRVQPKSGRPVLNWIRKYGEDRIEMVVLDTVRAENKTTLSVVLCAIEIHHIGCAEEYGYSLLNATAGGDGVVDPSPETRQKMREAKLGKAYHTTPHTPESRAKMSAVKTGELSNRYGTKHSPETIEKMRAAALNRAPISAETRKKMLASPTQGRGAHTRYHTNLGRTSPDCRYCIL